MALIPPAAPQAASTRNRSVDTRITCPMPEPMALPIWTIGPSGPAEPPAPMQAPAVTAVSSATRGGMRPPRKATLAMM